jgi:hypothetical protein
LDRRLCGHQNRSRRGGEKKSFDPAGNWTLAVQPVARLYRPTDWSVGIFFELRGEMHVGRHTKMFIISVWLLQSLEMWTNFGRKPQYQTSWTCIYWFSTCLLHPKRQREGRDGRANKDNFIFCWRTSKETSFEMNLTDIFWGDAVAQLVEALCYKPASSQVRFPMR